MPLFYVTGSRQQQREHFIPMTSPLSPHHKLYSVSPFSHDKTLNGPKNKAFVYKGKTKLCTKYRLLVLLLGFFVLVAFVMGSLFLWQVHLNRKDGAKQHDSTQSQQAPVTQSCRRLPQPIALPDLQQVFSDKLKKMEEFIMKTKFGALSANLVYRDSVIWSGTFGVMNKSEIPPRKPKASTIYPCASISKVFTALIVYKLLDENKITSLDDPVTKYDANFKIKRPFNQQHKITLRNLLEMSSGIPREAPCYPSTKENMCPYNHDVMMKRIQNSSLLVEPNTILQYSNFGYALLGNVIAKRFSGGDYNALVKKYVLDPLGMTSTMLSLNPNQLKNVPIAYAGDKVSQIARWGWLDPAGGFFTTVEDLSKMVIQLMSDSHKDRYLSEYTTRRLLSVAKILPDGTSMTGTPWEMQLVDGIVHREKGGSVFGYEAAVAMVPELRIAVNVLCTNCVPYRLTNTYFINEVVPTLKQHLIKKQHKEIVLPPNYEAYVGTYVSDNVPIIRSFVIVKEDNKLSAYVNDLPYFYFNYTAPRTFKLLVNTDKMNCMRTYLTASVNEVAVFDEISNRDGLSHGFVLHAGHPSGKTYIYRVPSSVNA